MKNLLYALTFCFMSISGLTIAQTSCQITYTADTVAGTYTYYAPADYSNPQEYVVTWESDSASGTGPSFTVSYESATTDAVFMLINQIDSSFVCSAGSYFEIWGGMPGCDIVYQSNQNPLSYTFSLPDANYPAVWTLPDGSVQSGVEVSYTFPGPGQYEVSMQVYGLSGYFCDDYEIITIPDGSPSSCVFSDSSNVETNQVILTAPDEYSNPAEYTVLWTYMSVVAGGSTTVSGIQSIINAGYLSSNEIVMTVYQGDSLVCSSTQLINLDAFNPLYDCGFAYQSVLGNNTYQFSLIANSPPSSQLSSIVWTLPNDSVLFDNSNFELNYTFAQGGTYEICATGYYNTYSVSCCIEVDVPVDSSNVACDQFCVTSFLTSDSIPNTGIIQVDFTGNLGDLINNPSVAFVTNLQGDTIAFGSLSLSNQAGGTTAEYSVQFANGIVWLPTNSALIHFTYEGNSCILNYPCNAPVVDCDASFYASESPLTGYFIALGNTTTPGTNYTWDYGDGETGNGPYVYHVYSQPGAYTACLTASNATCFETQCQTIVIESELTSISDSLCDAEFAVTQQTPFEVTVINASTAVNANFTWVLSGNGTNITLNGAYPSVTVDTIGTFYLCLNVENENCTSVFCDSLVIDGDGLVGGRLSELGFTINVTSPQAITGYNPTGIQSANTLLGVYPNPFADQLIISGLDKGVFSLMGIDGKMLNSGSINSSPYTFDTNDLSRGTYFLTILSSTGERFTRRIVKMN
jgi:hypothetical protein